MHCDVVRRSNADVSRPRGMVRTHPTGAAHPRHREGLIRGKLRHSRGAEMKPYVTCHMNASIDGRILGSRWRPAENRMAGLFERLHEELGGGSWLIGRVTGSEYAKAAGYPDHTDQTYPREPWFARRDAAAYGIALDTRGKIAWGRSDIGGDPIVVVLTEQVSDAH